MTTYLLPLSFPRSRPHVSRLCNVFTRAIDRNRGRQLRGNLTVLSSRTLESVDVLCTIREADAPCDGRTGEGPRCRVA